MLLMAMGLLFQIPVGILAVTRVGIVTTAPAAHEPPLRDPGDRGPGDAAARPGPGHDADDDGPDVRFVRGLYPLSSWLLDRRAARAAPARRRSWRPPTSRAPARPPIRTSPTNPCCSIFEAPAVAAPSRPSTSPSRCSCSCGFVGFGIGVERLRRHRRRDHRQQRRRRHQRRAPSASSVRAADAQDQGRPDGRRPPGPRSPGARSGSRASATTSTRDTAHVHRRGQAASSTAAGAAWDKYVALDPPSPTTASRARWSRPLRRAQRAGQGGRGPGDHHRGRPDASRPSPNLADPRLPGRPDPQGRPRDQGRRARPQGRRETLKAELEQAKPQARLPDPGRPSRQRPPRPEGKKKREESGEN